jgi:hypothetical protein
LSRAAACNFRNFTIQQANSEEISCENQKN